MEYIYKTLSQDERDDMLVETLISQETDLYVHTVNLERYQAMLPLLENGDFKTKTENEIETIKTRIEEVNIIITALETQLPPTERIEQSKIRRQANKSDLKK